MTALFILFFKDILSSLASLIVLFLFLYFFFVILVMAIVICLTNFQLLIFPFLLLEVVGKGVVHLAP